MSQAVMRAIVMTAEYYGRQLSETVLQMYAEDLADLPPDQVLAGYAQYRRNPQNKTFPLPAQIRELVAPEQFVSVETQAREIAARIVGAIPSFGWNNGRQAQLYIGPIGWAAVQRAGGWSYLCENVGIKIHATTLQAQLRDQLEGTIRYGSHAIEQAIGIEPRDERPQLESAADILRRLSPSEPDGGGTCA